MNKKTSRFVLREAKISSKTRIKLRKIQDKELKKLKARIVCRNATGNEYKVKTIAGLLVGRIKK
tara:strand:- start:673 stop:864 length:192 start_codon:yes stop_codon:yes gene_type:complete